MHEIPCPQGGSRLFCGSALPWSGELNHQCFFEVLQSRSEFAASLVQATDGQKKPTCSDITRVIAAPQLEASEVLNGNSPQVVEGDGSQPQSQIGVDKEGLGLRHYVRLRTICKSVNTVALSVRLMSS